MDATVIGRMEATESLSTLSTPLSKKMTNVQLGLVSATLVASVITIIINPLTLLALIKEKMITKIPINLFIASLCCSDFFIGFAVFLFQLQKLLQLTSTNVHLITILNCVGGTLSLTGFVVSNINVLLVSVDRAYATLAPFKYKTHMSIKRATIVLAVAWTNAILHTVIPVAINVAGTGLFIVDYTYDLLADSLRLYWGTPFLYICTAANVVLYFIIVISFFKITNKVQPSTSSSELRNLRMTRTVTMVIGALLIGNIPISTMAVLADNPDAPYLWSYAMFYDIGIMCATIPTFINNFLYVWQLPDFNRAFRRLLPLTRITTEASDSNPPA
ncbi:hypothetical protein CAPTEDRAFT_203019 [Capitella teleta]|uniref:G-protein coupled receptors family 1 profile domain-containing protein n=1 Tax=Capitella teleta TaxID=283909 RepID=R7TNB1_CAPTE|nr:hypothetical protein CAPTEDRAFT_203019 [Capitella teleta]|eukprot:ELT95129.1 hypothetical protein CAPTEDRAFT_203019 [Capitella teleta]